MAAPINPCRHAGTGADADVGGAWADRGSDRRNEQSAKETELAALSALAATRARELTLTLAGCGRTDGRVEGKSNQRRKLIHERIVSPALWASRRFHRSDSFREGALLAVNLGDNADTTGAIYGQIAGAHYGAWTIPAAWRDKLTMVAEITRLADHLHDYAARPPEPQEGPPWRHR